MSDELSILSMHDTPAGEQGAKLLTVRTRTAPQRVARIKWRPQSSAGFINEPRKELAAYAVQKLLLEPAVFVVPPTVARCFPLEDYRLFQADARVTFEGTDCVFGFASYWLEDIKTVEAANELGWLDSETGILDKKRYKTDPIYRESIAHANLLTYLINHGDAHSQQFLVERWRGGLRVYVVDSSIAFLSIKNPMVIFRGDWSDIQVPALVRDDIERLRALSEDDYATLSTIARFERNNGRLEWVGAGGSGEPVDLEYKAGVLRVGLTSMEIDLVKERAHQLLASRHAKLEKTLVAGSPEQSLPSVRPRRADVLQRAFNGAYDL